MSDNTNIYKQNSIKTYVVYLIFAISGASALIYQIIWARWLGLVFGNTTLSISIVLGSFMTGLALGSWLAGRFLHHIENPLRYYAYMELGIGVFALCFPIVTNISDLIFTTIINPDSQAIYSVLVKATLSSFILLVPTTLMGATLPLLTDFFHRSQKHGQNWKVGILYAANTFGAALGIFAASFILIELIGVLATTFAAAAFNIIVAAIGYRLSVSAEPRRMESAKSFSKKLSGPGMFAVWVITLSGALALASEVLWTRTLETIVGNSTYAFSTIVLIYLLGIAFGSWIMSLIVNRIKVLPVWLAALQLGMGIWTVNSMGLFEGIINSIAEYKMTMVPLSIMFVHYFKVIVILFPLSLLSGACFPLATRIIDPESKDAKGALVAKAYSWNTIGALIGSFATGFMIAPFWDYLSSLYVLSALYCLTALAAFVFIGIYKWQISYRVPLALVMGLLSAFLAFFSLGNAGDESYYVRRFNAKNPDFKMVFHKPGLQGVTSVIRHISLPRQDMLLVNGIGMTVKVTDTKMMAHFPMLIHPDPQNTLVICLGMGTTYRSAVSYGHKVTVVELVKEVVDAFDYFYSDALALKTYKNGRIIVNDGRNFLKLTKEKFDVITIDPPPPIDAAGVNNLHSKEFILLAKQHLNNGGIMAHWIPFPGTNSETIDMLVRTFANVFPYTYTHKSLNGIGLHVIGSMKPIIVSENAIKNKLANKSVFDDLNEWDKPSIDFISSGWIIPSPEFLAKPLITTDNKPYLEFYLLRTLKSGGKKMFPLSFW